MTEQSSLKDENSTRLDRVVLRTTDMTSGAAIAVLLTLGLLLVTGDLTHRVNAAVFLVGSVLLALGFVGRGVRATVRHMPGSAVSFVTVAIWIAFAILQIVTLAD